MESEYLGRTMENHMQNCWSSFPWGPLGSTNIEKNMENSPPRKPFETCFHGGFSIYYVFGPGSSLAWDVTFFFPTAGLSENGMPRIPLVKRHFPYEKLALTGGKLHFPTCPYFEHLGISTKGSNLFFLPCGHRTNENWLRKIYTLWIFHPARVDSCWSNPPKR